MGLGLRRHFQAIGDPLLRQVEGALGADFGARFVDVEGVDGAFVRLVPLRRDAAECGIDGAVDRARIADVESTAAGGEGDAVGLNDGVVDEEGGSCVGIEAVRSGGELRGGVGEGVEPRVLGVGEKDVLSDGVDGDVVDRVEVVAKVVVEEDRSAVGGRVKRPE